MQGGGDPQTGGFLDPGTAALIAAILSGGVGFYGYTHTSSKEKEDAIQRGIAAAEAAAKAAGLSSLKAESESKAALKKRGDDAITRLQRAEAEIALLKNRNQKLEQTSGPAMAFRNASPETLNAAVQPTLDALKTTYAATYPWLNTSELSNLKKALEYPGSSLGRLGRMTFADFYSKQILPAAIRDKQAAASGGRRRYRRRRYYGGRTLEEAKADLARLESEEASAMARGRNEPKNQTFQGRLESVRREVQGLEAAEAEKKAAAKKAAEQEANRAKALAQLRQVESDTAGRNTARREEAAAAASEAAEQAAAAATAAAEAPIFPSLEDFGTLYGNILNNKNLFAQQVIATRQKDTATRKATEAAKKAAATLADKLEKEVANARAEIDNSQSIRLILSPKRQVEINKVLDKLNKLIQEAEGKDYLALEKPVEAKKKGWFRGGSLRNLKDLAEWESIKNRTPKPLLDEIQETTKEFVAAVKSQKAEEKKSFKAPPIRFGLPKIPVLEGNPFEPLIKVLAEATTQTEQVNAIRTQTKEAVKFMKENIKNAKTIVKEINSLAGIKASKPKKTPQMTSFGGVEEASTPRSESSEGTEASNPPAETDKIEIQDGCSAIQADSHYVGKDLLWFKKNMEAILYGTGEEEVEKEETRTYADSSDSTADYVALEPGLEKLNTGILASTADWFKSVRGKQLTYDFYLFLKVGNAYARLRCYIDQARDLLNDPERLTYVQRARNLFKRTPPPASTEPTFSAPGSNSTQQPAAASLQLSGPPSSSSVNASAESDPHEDLLQAILEGDTSKVGEIFQSNRDLTPNNPLVIPPSSPYRDEYYGDTSLRVAVKNDNVPMAKFLLENGAKANYRPGPAGALPALLFIAKSPEMVRTLVSVGRDKANVNEVETNVAGLRGYTPLAYELRRPRGELGNRSIEKIRMLLELGADPDAPAPDDPNLLETINTVRDIAEYNYQETKSDTDREIAQLFSKTEEERAAQQQPVGLGEEAAAAQQQPVGLGEPATARPPPPPPPARRKSWSPPPPPRPGQEVVGVVASPPVEDPAVTSIRATINNARTAYQSRQATKDATMAAINAAEAELRALQGPKVQTRANLLNEIADLRKTIRGGRRRKTPRKRTLKKRRGGKQNVRGPRHR